MPQRLRIRLALVLVGVLGFALLFFIGGGAAAIGARMGGMMGGG